MKILTLAVFVLAGLLFGLASASFPDQLSAEEFFHQSEYVAFVRIESGEIHRINGDRCGTRHKVEVLNRFKGDFPATATLYTGPSISPPIVGESYLVFLTKKVGFNRREMVQFSGMPDSFLSKCKTDDSFLYTDLLIAQELDGTTASLLIPSRIIAFPESMISSTKVSSLGNMAILEPVYVSLDRVFVYLTGLGQSKGGT